VTKYSAVMLTKAQIPHFYCMCHSTPHNRPKTSVQISSSYPYSL